MLLYPFIYLWKLRWLPFPDSSVGKESACNAGDLGSILWDGEILWGRERLPTPAFWPGELHGVVKSWTQLRNFHFHFKPRAWAQGACESKSQKITHSVFTFLVSGVPGLGCDFCKAVGKISERERLHHTWSPVSINAGSHNFSPLLKAQKCVN